MGSIVLCEPVCIASIDDKKSKSKRISSSEIRTLTSLQNKKRINKMSTEMYLDASVARILNQQKAKLKSIDSNHSWNASVNKENATNVKRCMV